MGVEISSQDVVIDGGTVAVSNFPATQPVSAAALPLPANAAQEAGGHLASIDAKLTNPLPISGTVTTAQVVSSSATVAQVTSTGANQTILAANANRKGAILFFASGIWFVKFGATASSTSFTYQVNSSNTTINVSIWQGQIDVFCTTGGKLVNVTEMV